ncbi:MAG: hypothetical protein ACLQVI_13215 [Polyangiaceae bacterium]|jgi:hypothetical protein
MSRRLSGSIGLALLVAVTGGSAAFAQDAPAPAPAASDAPAASPEPAGSAATPAPAGSSSSSAQPSLAKGSGVTGYAYGGRSAPSPVASSETRHHHGLYAHHANEAVATFTGFEMLADGGSRLFVQLSKQVDVGQEKVAVAHARKAKKGQERAAESRLKFVLKGTEVVNPLNEHALVTVHFNTPVVRARLVPAGSNLDLMVELRADVTPEMKIIPAKDNGAMLQIDFPKGSYLPAGEADADPAPAPAYDATAGGTLPATAPASNDAAPAPTPTPAPQHHGGHHHQSSSGGQSTTPADSSP